MIKLIIIKIFASLRLCVTLFLFYSFSAFPQKYNDFTVSLNEEAINKVFVAIGDISGSSDYEVMLIKGQ